jgi:DNA-binding HxlR family transcriptional regulator
MAVTNRNVLGDATSEHDCKGLVCILARVGDKWTIMIVGSLTMGPKRYNEIRRHIGGISQRMLTLKLKSLEQDGIVTRTVYPTIPPRVDYELTKLGRTLRASLTPLHNWAMDNRQTIATARKRFLERTEK